MKKNTISAQIIVLRAGATTSCPWSYCSALTHTVKYIPSIGAGLYKKLNSLTQVFWGEWKVKVLWKNLGCLCRLAAWFIILFQRALWLSGGLFICLISSGNAVWAKGLSALHRAVQTLWFIYDRVKELLIMLPFLQGNVYEIQSFPAQTLIETLIALFPEI